MCDEVSVACRPLNVTLIPSVCATLSQITTALPIPVELTGGDSFAPLRMAENVLGLALRFAGASRRVRTAARTNLDTVAVILLRSPGTVNRVEGAGQRRSMQSRARIH